jgi:hypothetical protein
MVDMLPVFNPCTAPVQRQKRESAMKHPPPTRRHPVAAFTAAVLLALAASAATVLPDHSAEASDALLTLPARLQQLLLP